MSQLSKYFALILLFLSGYHMKLSAQISDTAYPESLVSAISVEELRNTIFELTSPALEGRELGSAGNMKAADWLKYTFRQKNMTPLPALGSFFHHFPVNRFEPEQVLLLVNQDTLLLHEDFTPAYFSANTSGFKEIEIADISFHHYEEMMNIHELVYFGHANEYQAVFLVTEEFTGTSGYRYEYKIDLPTRATKTFENTSQPHVESVTSEIPIIFISPETYNKIQHTTSIGLSIELKPVERRTAQNIIGYIGPEFFDETSTQYVLVTSHFDHEGMHPVSGIPFFGAVDNASGIAAMLESIRLLNFVSSRLTHPIVFIAQNGRKRDNAGLQKLLREYGLVYNNVILHLEIDSPSSAPRGQDNPPLEITFHNLPETHKEYLGVLGTAYELSSFTQSTEIPSIFAQKHIKVGGGYYPYRDRILDSPDKVNMTQLYYTTLFITELLWNYATISSE